MTHINPVQRATPYMFQIYYNIVLLSNCTSPKRALIFRPRQQYFGCVFPLRVCSIFLVIFTILLLITVVSGYLKKIELYMRRRVAWQLSTDMRHPNLPLTCRERHKVSPKTAILTYQNTPLRSPGKSRPVQFSAYYITS